MKCKADVFQRKFINLTATGLKLSERLMTSSLKQTQVGKSSYSLIPSKFCSSVFFKIGLSLFKKLYFGRNSCLDYSALTRSLTSNMTVNYWLWEWPIKIIMYHLFLVRLQGLSLLLTIHLTANRLFHLWMLFEDIVDFHPDRKKACNRTEGTRDCGTPLEYSFSLIWDSSNGT